MKKFKLRSGQTIDLTGKQWVTHTGQGAENCLETMQLADDVVLVRHSSDPKTAIEFTGAEIAAFIQGYRAQA